MYILCYLVNGHVKMEIARKELQFKEEEHKSNIKVNEEKILIKNVSNMLKC